MIRIPRDAVERVGRLLSSESSPVGLLVDGRYEVLSRLAGGGMGEVFHAHDRRLNRSVAMKVLAPGLLASKWAARFEAEALTTTRIDHPGVVPIFDLGLLPDGRLYYTMKYVGGGTLQERMSRSGNREDLLRLLIAVCDIVERAHEKGVVHCDLKPTNIMVDEREQAYVLDWGIARAKDEAFRAEGGIPGGAPRATTVLGTVEYMSPEQASGDLARIGPASDVYSLGAILYEILTGRTPPVPLVRPREAKGDVPGQLEAICLKALDPDPARRFGSARELAQSLRERGPKRSRGIVAGVLGALLVASVLGGAWISRRSVPTMPVPEPPSGAWVELGGSGTGVGISGQPDFSCNPSLALDAAGRPFVAWQDVASGNWEIYLRFWDGSAWRELGGSATGGGLSATPGASGSPCLVMDRNGRPVVAWDDNSNGSYDVYLKRWNGSAWIELGGSATGGGISRLPDYDGRPSLALDSKDRPVIAWARGSEILLRRWDGKSWEELGGSAGPGGISRGSGITGYPCVALDAQDRPVVAWHGQSVGIGEIYLRRWDGTEWQELGGSGTGEGLSRTKGDSANPKVAVDGAGRLIVAWHDNTAGNYRIYLRRWSGSMWEELGGSATAQGISETRGVAVRPSLGLDRLGHPVVAWDDIQTGNYEVRLERWTGTRWTSWEGSAGPGGGSHTPADLSLPSLALDTDGNPVVAWQDKSSGTYEIMLRRWLASPSRGRR